MVAMIHGPGEGSSGWSVLDGVKADVVPDVASGLVADGSTEQVTGS